MFWLKSSENRFGIVVISYGRVPLISFVSM